MTRTLLLALALAGCALDVPDSITDIPSATISATECGWVPGQGAPEIQAESVAKGLCVQYTALEGKVRFRPEGVSTCDAAELDLREYLAAPGERVVWIEPLTEGHTKVEIKLADCL